MFWKWPKFSLVKKGPGAHLLLSMFKKAFRKEHPETDLQWCQSRERRVCLGREQSSHSMIWEEPTQAGVLASSKTPVGICSPSSSSSGMKQYRPQTPTMTDLLIVNTLRPMSHSQYFAPVDGGGHWGINFVTYIHNRQFLNTGIIYNTKNYVINRWIEIDRYIFNNMF